MWLLGHLGVLLAALVVDWGDVTAYTQYEDTEVDDDDDVDFDDNYESEDVAAKVVTTPGTSSHSRIKRFGDHSRGARTLSLDEIRDVKDAIKELLAGRQLDHLTTKYTTGTVTDDQTDSTDISTKDPAFTGLTKIDNIDPTKFYEDIIEELIDSAKRQGLILKGRKNKRYEMFPNDAIVTDVFVISERNTKPKRSSSIHPQRSSAKILSRTRDITEMDEQYGKFVGQTSKTAEEATSAADNSGGDDAVGGEVAADDSGGIGGSVVGEEGGEEDSGVADGVSDGGGPAEGETAGGGGSGSAVDGEVSGTENSGVSGGTIGATGGGDLGATDYKGSNAGEGGVSLAVDNEGSGAGGIDDGEVGSGTSIGYDGSYQMSTTKSTMNPFMTTQPTLTTSSRRKTRRRRTTTTPMTTVTTTTTTTPEPEFDIPALVDIISNLTYDFETNITQMFNQTLLKYNIPTCKTPPTTTTEHILHDFINATVIAKCFVCGMEEPGIPRNAYCADAFAGDFLPLVPVDPQARGHIARFRKYCRYLDVNGYYENATQPRSIYGRFTGGCSVRWIDLSGVYTQRACRNTRHTMMGLHFASKRMAKLEMALREVDNGCIISPMASLVPLSRGVSLYARFHACVCTGSWCNVTSTNRQWITSIVILTLLTIAVT